MEKDKSRGRSKCEFANLVRELNEAIDRFHRSSEEVEKIDDLVKGIKRELDVKKEQVIQENDKLLGELQAARNERELLLDEKEKLVELNDEAQETIKLYEKIVEFNKNGIEASANENLNQKVQLAELESKLMLYRKSIELLG